MADGVPITAGSGTTIATDDTGATGHVQLVKLGYSANGSATLVQADVDGILVNLGAHNDVITRGPSSFATGQVTVSTTATTLVASRSGRTNVVLLNYGICTVWVGPATVTTSNGIALDPGATLTLSTTALIQGIAPTGFSGIVHYVEEY